MLLVKGQLNTIEVRISEALIDSYISHDKFVSVNNMLREYNEMKEEIKNLKTSVKYITKTMEIYCVSWKKYTANETSSVRKTNQNRLMLLSNCAICGKKKSTFIKNQELQNVINVLNN